MIVDWLKHNMIAAVIGLGVGTSIVGGSVVYVAGPSQFWQGITGEAPFPPRFHVRSNGGHDFACDLTITQNASCTSHDPLVMTLVRITIRRHAGDPSRIAIHGYGTDRTGVTWADLQKGIVLGPSSVAGRTLGPVTVVARAPLN